VQHGRGWATLTIVGMLVAVLAACGGGDSTSDSGDSGDGGSCAEPSFSDLTGIWTIENKITGDCQDEVDVYEVYVELSGDQLRIIGKTSFTATLCGSRAAADRPISYVRNGGVETVTNLVLQFSSDTRFTGTAAWTWTFESSTCSGNMAITGGR